MTTEPTTLEQVLTQRLATQHDIVNVDEPVHKLVVFELGGQCFAFHGERIREILAQADVFFVPGSPSWLEGVINVRGDIESVIRPHALLHLAEDDVGRASKVLLGQSGAISSGIRVDRVLDVVDVNASQIAAPPATVPEHLRQLVLGVLTLQARPVALLDLDLLLAEHVRELG